MVEAETRERINIQVGSGQKYEAGRVFTSSMILGIKNLRAVLHNSYTKYFILTAPYNGRVKGGNGTITIDWDLRSEVRNVYQYEYYRSTSSATPPYYREPTGEVIGALEKTTNPLDVFDNQTYHCWIRAQNNSQKIRTDWLYCGSANSGTAIPSYEFKVKMGGILPTYWDAPRQSSSGRGNRGTTVEISSPITIENSESGRHIVWYEHNPNISNVKMMLIRYGDIHISGLTDGQWHNLQSFEIETQDFGELTISYKIENIQSNTTLEWKIS
jgi:hypothetical protein